MKNLHVISIIVTFVVVGLALSEPATQVNSGIFDRAEGARYAVNHAAKLQPSTPATLYDSAPQAAADQASCVVPPPNMVSWYRAEGDFSDFVGGNSGTQTGGVGFATGKVGQAFNLDGSNDIISFGNPVNLQLTNALTAEAWIRPDSTFGDYRTVVSKWSQTANASWGLFVTDNRVFGIVGNGAGQFTDAVGGTIPFGTTAAFTHVAMTYSAADGIRVYVNGVLVQSDVGIGNIHNGTDVVRIGNDSGLVGVRYFDGLIDEVGIFGRVLSATEIQSIYNAGVDGKCTSPNPPPANDNFANAQIVNDAIGVVTGSNVGATKQAGEPNHGGDAGGASVWYRWEAPATGSAYVNTLGSDIDTLLGVYTGSGVNALTLVGDSDNFIEGGVGYVQSQVRFDAVAGTVYHIVVDGKAGVTGNITVRWGVNKPVGCVVPPANMVSWWPGDGNANDIKGTNNGTLQGGATATAAGKVGQAFSLNGTTRYVSLGNPASLKISGAITIDAWINPAALQANGALSAVMTKWAQDFSLSSTSDSYGLWTQNQNGTLRLFSALHFTTGSEPNISGGTIPLNAWSHVAMTFDPATGRYAIYVNGEEVAVQMHPGNNLLATDRNVAIGKEESHQTRFFNGLIDEVEIFTRALAQSEIQAIYNAGPAGKCKPGSSPPNNDFANAQVVSGPIGTVTGINLGANKQTGEPDHGGNAGGASVWYRWQAPASGPAYFNTLGSDFDTLLGIYTGSSVDSLTLIGGNDNFIEHDIGYIQSQVRFDAVAGTTYYIAVDGKAGATGNVVLRWGVSSASGCIAPPSGMVGWWTGDGTANDIQGTHHGTLQNGTSFSGGIVGQAFNMDGVDDHVSISGSSVLGVQSLTIDAWIYPTDLSISRPIVEYAGVTGPAGPHLWQSVSASGGQLPGALTANIRDSSSGNHVVGTTTAVLTANQWQHVAVTYDGQSGAAAVYVNGASVATANLGTFNPQTPFFGVLLGQRPVQSTDSLGGRTFAGAMDEVEIFNRALAATEIQAIYNAANYGKCRPGQTPPPTPTPTPTPTPSPTSTPTPSPTPTLPFCTDGDLDPTFNGTGKVAGDPGTGSDMVMQPDGKFVVVGRALLGTPGRSGFQVARYLPDGALDISFGTSGIVTTEFAGVSADPQAIALQSDGRLVVAGFTTPSGTRHSALARYTSSGALDTSFGNGGTVVTEFFVSDSSEAHDVAIQPDGKIITVGRANVQGASNSFISLARYTTMGALDTSFDADGKVTTSFTGYPYAIPSAIALQADGKIVTAGRANTSGPGGYNFALDDFMVARHNADGTVDTGFGTNGQAVANINGGDDVYTLAIQPDGKILAGGEANYPNDQFALARFTTAGVLDNTFGTGGKTTTTFVSSNEQQIRAIAIQTDGKIVAAGYAKTGPGTGIEGRDFALARFSPDGALDTSFGVDGKISTDFFGNFEGAEAVAIQPDGKIVAAGYARNPAGTTVFALARYLMPTVNGCPTGTPTPTPGGPPGLTADYQFQNTRNSSTGGPPMTDLINVGNGANTFTTESVEGCIPRSVLNFPKGNGLSLVPTTGLTTDNKTYSIVILFKFTEQDHTRAIVDFKNGTDGRGIYADTSNNLNFPNSQNNATGISSGSGSPITANKYVQVVLTRQGNDGNLGRAGIDIGYVDGVHQYLLNSNGPDGIIDPQFNTLRFFINQVTSARDYSGGSVARIRLFNRVLSASEVAALDRLPGGSCTGPTPTPTPTPTVTPTPAPGGGRIVYTSDLGGFGEIYVMNADGSGKTRLTNDAIRDEHPEFTPDSSRIVFQRVLVQGELQTHNPEIFVMNADGTSITNLTNSNQFIQDVSPTVSPVDGRIAFVSTRDDGGIFIMNPDGSGVTRLTTVAGDAEPSFSPLGDKIVFVRRTPGFHDIYVMNVDGTNQVRVTNDQANNSHPSLAPDGRIAYASNRDGGGTGIFVMNADGTNPTRITNVAQGMENFEPKFSSDGSRILFTRFHEVTNFDVYVMNADGTGQTRLTDDPVRDFLPSWAPGPVAPTPTPTVTPTPTPTPTECPVNTSSLDGSGGQQRAILTTTDAGRGIVVFPDASGSPEPQQLFVTGLPPGANPHGASFYGTDNALVADTPNNRVFVIQVSTGTLLSTINTSGYNGTGTIAVAPDASAALAMGTNANLFVIRAPFNASSTVNQVTLPGGILGGQTQGIVFDGAGRAFVSTTAGVSVLDPPYDSVAFNITSASSVGAPIAITPDGNTLLVGNSGGNNVRIFNAPFSASSVAQTLVLPTETSMAGMMVTPDGTKALTANFPRAVFAISAPFTSSSTVESLPLPPPGTGGFNAGFEDVGISLDSQIAIIAGAETGEAPVFIRAPFTAAGAQSYYVPIQTGGPERGRGAARFQPPCQSSAIPTPTQTPTPTPSPTPSGPPGLTADYQFQNTRNSSGGGPLLTDIITGSNGANTFTTEAVEGCAPRAVLNFPKGNGLSLAPTTGLTTDNKTYSIVMLFKFTEQDHLRAIVDFKNGVDGRGIYADANNNLAFPNSWSNGNGVSIGTGSPITANKYVQVVLTRQGSDANLGRAGVDIGYLDRTQQYLNDSLNADGIIDADFNVLRFFINQLTSSQDYSGGSVSRIRLFNRVLTASEVAALDRLPDGACITPSPIPTPTVTPTPGGTPTPTPTPTPPASSIVFSSNRDGNFEIYVMNADGSGQTRLTNNPASDVHPVFSADGTRIVFQSDRDGVQQIYVMNRDGSGQTRLTNTSANENSPSVSRVDNRIAFASGRDGNFEIYVMNLDGSNQMRLTINTEHDFEPAWSPDGTKIAFRSTRDGNEEIYVMNADGTGEVRLTNSPLLDRDPTWTPDGRIVFASVRNNEHGIYVMNPDGTNVTRIPNTGPNDVGPSVSPDGERIVFFGDRVGSGNQEIFVMAADGSGQVNISNNIAFDFDPHWEQTPGTPMPSDTIISGRVTTPSGSGLRNARVSLTDSQGERRSATTSSLGFYSFDMVRMGEPFVITVTSKRYRFLSRTETFNGSRSDIDFLGIE